MTHHHLHLTLTGAVFTCLVLVACGRQSEAPGRADDPTPPAIRYEAHVAAGGVAPRAGVLRNIHEADTTLAKRGAQLFTAMNCDGCHGGEGTGSVGPSLQDGRWRYGGVYAEIFQSIYYGRPKGMPAFGGVLGTEGTWALVNYLKSLPVPADIATESWEKPCWAALKGSQCQ